MARITVYISDELWNACKAADYKLNSSQLIQLALSSWLELVDPITAGVLRLTPEERIQALIKAERDSDR